MPEIKPALSGRWRTFLTELDVQLPAPVELHCLGGFVLAVCYGLPRPTGDVDYIAAIPQSGSENIQALAGEGSKLARKHGLHFQYVTIADVPEDYEHRVTRIFAEGFVNLRLCALEAHDLVLAKLSRNHPKDAGRRKVSGSGRLVEAGDSSSAVPAGASTRSGQRAPP